MQADFIKVTSHADILTYDILSTPALVINEQLMCSARIPTQAEVAAWMKAA